MVHHFHVENIFPLQSHQHIPKRWPRYQLCVLCVLSKITFKRHKVIHSLWVLLFPLSPLPSLDVSQPWCVPPIMRLSFYIKKCLSLAGKAKKVLNGSTFLLWSAILYLLPQVDFFTFNFPLALHISLKDCIVIGVSHKSSLRAFYSHDTIPPWRVLSSPFLTYSPLICVGTFTEFAFVMRLPGLPRDLFRNLSRLCCQNFISESLPVVLRGFCFHESLAWDLAYLSMQHFGITFSEVHNTSVTA